ncbi:protein phosphatase 2C-like domain-containing protein 1 [Monodelphis domestica]|uniref:protein phosphatase 2C-like domain-containing protein 1 n=1 Tax=Monodelphis domestica TaxID=13616 RepID=UPI0024E1BC84|nr:protein phosphatase 2C-like domain-containing protein 1 [Monodelphis domestica]XP_007505215.2 protein phosphatase 2C-like domain-containing protein 1 [Monodelphis domestica]
MRRKKAETEIAKRVKNLSLQEDFPISTTYRKSELAKAYNAPLLRSYRFRDVFRLTIPCSLCNEELRPSEFFIHKKKHKAMGMLGYTWVAGEKPERHKVLTKRQFLISTFIEAHLYNEKTKRSLDSACEFLCKHPVPSYYKIFSTSFNSSVHFMKTNNPLVKSVAICEDQNKTWRPVMEDRYIFRGKFGQKFNTCYFGLFDGHHGSVAAETSAAELHKFLLEQLSQYDPSYKMTSKQQKFVHSFNTVFRRDYRTQEYHFSSQRKSNCSYELVHKAFAKAFWRMDRVLKLGRQEMSSFYWSGCSAVTCLLECDAHSSSSSLESTSSNSEEGLDETGILHVANVGNVHVVLCKNGKAHLLTKDHTTQSVSERDRVLSRGGKISTNEPTGFTEETVKITRGLGFHGNAKLKRSVIPAPQTISVHIDNSCQFLIVATTGLWGVLDKNEATAIAMSLFSIYTDAYKSRRDTYKSFQQRMSFLPSISASSISTQDSKIKLLYRNSAAFRRVGYPQDITRESSRQSLMSRKNSLISENLDKSNGSKSRLNSKTEISSARPFYLYGIEESDETSSLSESSKSDLDSEIQKNFYDYAAEYVSHGLVKAAMTAGSRENITVLVVVLEGCDSQLQGP